MGGAYHCCLCQAFGDERPGRIREGEGVPLCAVHRAEVRWKRSAPQQLPPPVDPLLVAMGRAALLG